jgi:hypothetical protein
MLVQYKDPGAAAWRSLVSVTPGTSRVATYMLTTNRTRSYPVYVPLTSSDWYMCSPPAGPEVAGVVSRDR